MPTEANTSKGGTSHAGEAPVLRIAPDHAETALYHQPRGPAGKPRPRKQISGLRVTDGSGPGFAREGLFRRRQRSLEGRRERPREHLHRYCDRDCAKLPARLDALDIGHGPQGLAAPKVVQDTRPANSPEPVVLLPQLANPTISTNRPPRVRADAERDRIPPGARAASDVVCHVPPGGADAGDKLSPRRWSNAGSSCGPLVADRKLLSNRLI